MIYDKNVLTEISAETEKKISSEFPYFSYAIGVLEKEYTDAVGGISTDGRKIYADPAYILSLAAKSGVSGTETAYMHILLHNVLLHTFRSDGSEEYDLAADICVFYLTDNMNLTFGEKGDIVKRKSVYRSINGKYGLINLQSAKSFAQGLSKAEFLAEKKLFTLCDHSPWKKRSGENGGESVPESGDDGAEEMWISIAVSASPAIGEEDADLKRAVGAIAESRSDYRRFLRKFIKMRERIKSSDEEFDYVFYTYGLTLYKNMPLVENLEYRQDVEVSDVIVAIDTSGSTQGEPVMRFLSEIYAMIKQAGETSERLRMRVIQCDDKIRSEEVIDGGFSFEKYMSGFGLSGGGGTDFRPVFDRATKLIKEGVKIRGLIYFTDGLGIFPKENPPYRSCFAIYGDADNVNVPYFSYKLKIPKETI